MLKNLKIRSKILLMLSFPIIGLIVFSTRELTLKRQVTKEMTAILDLSNLTLITSTLVDELQKERGLSAGYLGSHGQVFGPELIKQRKVVDNQITDLEKFLSHFNNQQYGSEFGSLLKGALTNFQIMKNQRKAVDSLSISVDEELNYYTYIIDPLVYLVNYISKLSTDADISRLLIAHSNFVLAKEKAEIERAILNNTFAQGEFAPGMYEKFTSLVSEQNTYIKVYLSLTTPQEISYYRSKVQGPYVDEINRMRQIAMKREFKGREKIKAVYWWNMDTGRLYLLKQVEDRIMKDLEGMATDLKNKAQMIFIFHLIFHSTAYILTLALMTFVVRSITHPLHETVKQINGIAGGDLTLRINIDSRDELGLLARSVNDFMEKLLLIISRIHEASEEITNQSTVVSWGASTFADTAQNQAAAAHDSFEKVKNLSSTIGNVADAVNQQARNVTEMNKHLEPLVASVTVIKMSLMQLASLAKEAATKAQSGEGVVKEATSAMDEIRDNSSRISEIIHLITEISDQTNLLALNAAIEAARAGDAGRGFTVVAEEITKLAERTVSSIGDIKKLIGTTNEAVENGHAQFGKAAGILHEIIDGVNRIDESVDKFRKIIVDQTKSVVSIANGVDNITRLAEEIDRVTDEQKNAMESITENVQNISQETESISNASKKLLEPATRMEQIALNLRQLVDQFRVK